MTQVEVGQRIAVVASIRAMACDVTVHGPTDTAAASSIDRALDVFRAVHRSCTRFDPTSPLMRMNARPGQWHEVPPVLFGAITEAYAAYERTQGRFDPRVLSDLVDLGYDRSLPFADGVDTPKRSRSHRRPLERWRPRFLAGRHPEIHLGGIPIDLGGIGKGLAVRWAAEILADEMSDFFVDAGGDCACRGTGPEEDGWRVGVEDPRGRLWPVAVLALRDRACATSSTRLRRWRSGAEAAHHLIDPATGSPGGAGLRSVTVVADDAAEAEVTTKSLFLAGVDGIAAGAASRDTAALWVGPDGTVGMSAAMKRYVVWTNE